MSTPQEEVEQELDTRIRWAVNRAIDLGVEAFTTSLDRAARDLGVSDERMSRAVAEHAGGTDWIEFWTEYIEEGD